VANTPIFNFLKNPCQLKYLILFGIRYCKLTYSNAVAEFPRPAKWGESGASFVLHVIEYL